MWSQLVCNSIKVKDVAVAFDFFSILLHSFTAKTNFSYTRNNIDEMIWNYKNNRESLKPEEIYIKTNFQYRNRVYQKEHSNHEMFSIRSSILSLFQIKGIDFYSEEKIGLFTMWDSLPSLRKMMKFKSI